ncbi:hypothetical protein ACTWQB_00210 [Piscibacillus sp. B03]|uniref:hypothetical protein n=1 Tax=Piscibacillus sp. B03 TaxID=3457430 RepID=UPI003FCDCFA8
MKLIKLLLGLIVFLGGLYSLFIGDVKAPDYVIFSVLAITFLLIGMDSLKEKSRFNGSLMLMSATVTAMIAIKDFVNLMS